MKPVYSKDAFKAFENVRTLSENPGQHQRKWQEFGNTFPAVREYAEEKCEHELNRMESIEWALEQGLETEEDVEDLVVQICYRAADLGFLLDRENASLSDYSKDLRLTPDRGMKDLENVSTREETPDENRNGENNG